MTNIANPKYPLGAELKKYSEHSISHQFCVRRVILEHSDRHDYRHSVNLSLKHPPGRAMRSPQPGGRLQWNQRGQGRSSWCHVIPEDCVSELWTRQLQGQYLCEEQRARMARACGKREGDGRGCDVRADARHSTDLSFTRTRSIPLP